MAIKGSLKEASLADVCQLLAMGQKNGCLSVTDRSRFGQIFFERGRITYARIVNRRDRLGDLLVREGHITEAQLADALDVQARQPERRLGEILVAAGHLEADALTAVVRLQIEEAVYHLFTWTRGSFYFEVEERPDPADVKVSINPEGLLLEAARRVDEWSLIEKKVPSLDIIFTIDVERLRESGVELTAEQEQLLPFFDGARTVMDVADASGIGEFDVGKALYGLAQAGFAHQVGRRGDEPTRGREADVAERLNLGIAFYRTAMFDDAAVEFRRALEAQPDERTAHFHLGLIALRQREFRDAVREFRAVVEHWGPNYATFLDLAHALGGLRQYGEALLVLDEAEAIRAGTPTVALTRGVLLLGQGDVEAARTAFAEYRRRLPNREEPSALYFYYAGVAAGALGQLDEAQTLCAKGLDRHPGAAPLLLLAGAVAERRGQDDAALRHFRRAAEESPGLAQAHKNLGDVAYRKGRPDEAAEHLRRAVELAPDLGDDVCTKLGNLCFRRMERDEAVAWWRRALELNPENRLVRSHLEVLSHAVG
ncbi:MAG TPA: DUF4388 domain-containing protein [Longimicrobiales bacterium]|nr:DUF4388 domain-containing protein [Longimicrobiales bacterium]